MLVRRRKVTSLARKIGVANVVQIGPGGITVEALLAEPASPNCSLPEETDLSAMFFTGGTTGVPKGANHIHRGHMAFCYGVAATGRSRWTRSVSSMSRRCFTSGASASR